MLELLLKIAQEKVGCDFDYYKGYNLLKDSLEGLDEQTINKLLIGEYSLKYTDNNKGEVVDVPQTNPLNILSLIECKLIFNLDNLFTGRKALLLILQIILN